MTSPARWKARWPLRVVLPAILLAGAVLFASLWFGVTDGPGDSPPTRWVPPRHNAWLAVPAGDPSEPRPLIIAWEMERLELPTFVLYEDGSWFFRTYLDLRSPYITGSMSVVDARALYARFLDVHLETAPPWQTRTPGAVCGDSATFCVTQRGRWVCASIQGWGRLPPVMQDEGPTPSGLRRRAREGVSADALPNPAVFRACAEALALLDTSSGREWSPRNWRLAIEFLGRDYREEYEANAMWLGSTVDWPSWLPPLTAVAAEEGQFGEQRVSAADVKRITAFLRKLPRHTPLRSGVGESLVHVPQPVPPAYDEIQAVRTAFSRLFGQ